MSLSDFDYLYGFTVEDAKPEKYNDSYMAMIDQYVIRSHSNNAIQLFRTELQAEVFARQFARGYNNGYYLDTSEVFSV